MQTTRYIITVSNVLLYLDGTLGYFCTLHFRIYPHRAAAEASDWIHWNTLCTLWCLVMGLELILKRHHDAAAATDAAATDAAARCGYIFTARLPVQQYWNKLISHYMVINFNLQFIWIWLGITNHFCIVPNHLLKHSFSWKTTNPAISREPEMLKKVLISYISVH